MNFKIYALLILFIFYSIYFIKKFIQKLNGIKTRQIGSNKTKSIRRVETFMSITTMLVVIIELLSIVFDYTILESKYRYLGLIIGLLGDFIFLISVITMKNSWRAGIPNKDKTNLITNGIYKISRNPAFLGFDLMYIGLSLLYFNIFNVFISILAIISLHFQILEEEKYLEKTFKEEYLNYKSRTLRYLGVKKL